MTQIRLIFGTLLLISLLVSMGCSNKKKIIKYRDNPNNTELTKPTNEPPVPVTFQRRKVESHWIQYAYLEIERDYYPDPNPDEPPTDPRDDWRDPFEDPINAYTQALRECGMLELFKPNCKDNKFENFSVIYQGKPEVNDRPEDDLFIKVTALQDPESGLVFFVAIDRRKQYDDDSVTQLSGVLGAIDPTDVDDVDVFNLSDMARYAAEKLAEYEHPIRSGYNVIAAIGAERVGNLSSGNQSDENLMWQFVYDRADYTQLHYLLEILINRDTFGRLQGNFSAVLKRFFIQDELPELSSELKSRYYELFRQGFGRNRGNDQLSQATADYLAFDNNYDDEPWKSIVIANAAQRIEKGELPRSFRRSIVASLTEEDGRNSTAEWESIRAVEVHGRDIMNFANFKGVAEKLNERGARSLFHWSLRAMKGYPEIAAHRYLLSLVVQAEADQETATQAYNGINLEKYSRAFEIDVYRELLIASDDRVKSWLQALIRRLEQLKEKELGDGNE